MSRRARVLAVLGAVAVLLAAWLTGPGAIDGPRYDPRSTRPAGTAAVLDVVRATGSTVEISDRPPADAATALLLVDGLSSDTREEVRSWVRQGGRLVVADPDSPLVDLEPAGGLGTGAVGPVRLPPRCPLLPESGPVLASDWRTYTVPDDATGCFPIGDGAWLVHRTVGEGEIVALGGADALTNRRLAAGDNAVLAVHLLAPSAGTRVQVFPLPRPGSGDVTLLDLVPDRVLHLVAAIVGVFVLVAWWRGRRLGRPVEEVLPLRVPGAALVDALGDLLQRAGDRQGAAAALRRELRRDVERSLGLGPGTPPDVVVQRVVERTGLDRDTVHAAVHDDVVADDGDLLRVARAAALVRRRSVGGAAPRP